MAENLISRMLGRRAPLPAETTAALERLVYIAEQQPVLREAVAVQSAIYRTVYAVPPRATALTLDPREAAARLAQGVPLLAGAPGFLDVAALGRLLPQLCAAVAAAEEQPAEAQAIARVARAGQLPLEELVGALAGGNIALVHERAAAVGLSGTLLTTLLRFSLLPALAELSASLESLRTGSNWGRGYCPTCGNWPALAEQRGLDQQRYLRCGLCAAQWAVDRLLCPACGCRDHTLLGYLHVEGEGERRAATCDNCHSYIKLLTTLTPIRPLDIAVEDIATLHLDMIALERGYAPL